MATAHTVLTMLSTVNYIWNYRCDDTDRGQQKYSEKNLPQCHLSTTNPTLNGRRLNPGLCGESMVSNQISHSMSHNKRWPHDSNRVQNLQPHQLSVIHTPHQDGKHFIQEATEVWLHSTWTGRARESFIALRCDIPITAISFIEPIISHSALPVSLKLEHGNVNIHKYFPIFCECGNSHSASPFLKFTILQLLLAGSIFYPGSPFHGSDWPQFFKPPKCVTPHTTYH